MIKKKLDILCMFEYVVSEPQEVEVGNPIKKLGDKAQ
jgi:hypothetical protein